jgi:hypothetical protein
MVSGSPISTAPAVDPAIMDRRGLGPFFTDCDSSVAEAGAMLGLEAGVVMTEVLV